MRVASRLACLCLCALAGLPEVAAAESRRLTIDEAEQLAIDRSPQLAGVAARTQAAEDLARSVRGRMLPLLRASNEYQHYDTAFSPAFPLPAGTPPIIAREQDTNTFVLTATQPLLGLGRLAEEYQAQRESALSTGTQTRLGIAGLRRALRLGYLRYFEARALAEIAHQSEQELDEQVTIAEAKLKAGVLTNADILRIKVARANARQQGVQAQAQADATRAAVLIALGIPVEDAVELVEPKELLSAAHAEPPKSKAAVEQALGARSEVALGQHLIAASQHQARSRLWSLLPDINLEGAYVRIDGQLFAPNNALSIGIKAQWAFWEWGASFYQLRASQKLVLAARSDLEQQKRQIANEVTAEISQSTAAHSAVGLAQETITSAEEAYRVTNVLLKAGSATTTDLLESQAALNQARLNLTRAQYQQAVAFVSLRAAMGESAHY